MARLYPVLCAADVDQLETWDDEQLSRDTHEQERAHLKECRRRQAAFVAELRAERPNWKPIEDNGRLTEEEIQRAREYPMLDLVEDVRKGKALCPVHGDTKPSMQVYEDGVKCFSCGWHADPIKWVMTVQGMSFRSAVRHLNAGGF